MSNFYAATSLIGGGTGSLDKIPGTGLADGDAAVTVTATQVYHYHLNATSGVSESSPEIIAPDTDAGTKRWELVSVSCATLDVMGGQIVFPATAVPSSDPNTLDDYERGTWTPTGANSPTSPLGAYTKIGKEVFCKGRITAGSGGPLGIEISGLPFAVSSVEGIQGGGNTTYQTQDSAQSWSVMCTAGGGGFRMRIGPTAQDLEATKIAYWAFNYTID